MDENKQEPEEEKLDMSKKPKEEVAVFGLGVLLNHQKKINETLDKIQRFLYFMEKRQTKILKVIARSSGMSQEEIERLEKQ